MAEKSMPALLIGSPMCKAYSRLQNLNKNRREPREIAKDQIEADVHLRFCCQLYEDQIRRGGFILHEHPATATSGSFPVSDESCPYLECSL